MTSPIPPAFDPSVRSRSRSPYRAVAMLLIVATVVGVALVGRYRASIAGEPAAPTQAAVTDTAARAPRGQRVRIRVLNTTTTRGLARRATMVLREFGYDVVDFDSDPRVRRTTTVIRSHTGHDDWGARVRRALGAGDVQAAAADSSRYVDFTVLIGSDWKPPTQPFRP